MSVEVNLPLSLRKYLGKRKIIECKQGMILEIINEICKRFPEIRDDLFSNKDKLKDYISVYVDGKNIRSLKGNKTMVKDGQKVDVIFILVGG